MRLINYLLGISAVFLFSSLSTFSLAFSWKCLGCQAGVEVLHFLYLVCGYCTHYTLKQNATESEILRAADYFCRHFADQDSFVCKGITSQFRDEFLYVLGRLVFSPSQLCGLLLRDCGTPVDPFGSNWTVPLPPKPSQPQPRKNEEDESQKISSIPFSTPLRILQLSDIHFDPDYLEGSEADCQEPVCCLQRVDRPKLRAGRWGTPANCDIPLRTVEHMLEHINRTHKLDIVLLSGDYIHHRDWAYNRQEHIDSIGNISVLLQKHLSAVPVFWTLGNHEGVPVNAFGPHFVPERFRPEWMYRAVLAEGHKTAGAWLPPSVDASAIYRGSYAVDLAPTLRLISLNNGYCDKTNMFIYINQTDPDGSLTWLVNELWEAENKEQTVYILAHIPPGDGECLESWSRNYYRIVVRFSTTIRAQFFGHTHFDSFSLFFADMDDPRSAPVSMLFTGPSVTTFQGLNPAYRLYTADPTNNWTLLDLETHFLNLSSSSSAQPEWELLYSAKSEYGLADMSAAEWNRLVGRIEKEPELASKFNRNYMRRDNMPCDARCLAGRVCAIRAAHHDEKKLCGVGSSSKRMEVQRRWRHHTTIKGQQKQDRNDRRDRTWFMQICKRMIGHKVLKWISSRRESV